MRVEGYLQALLCVLPWLALQSAGQNCVVDNIPVQQNFQLEQVRLGIIIQCLAILGRKHAKLIRCGLKRVKIIDKTRGKMVSCLMYLLHLCVYDFLTLCDNWNAWHIPLNMLNMFDVEGLQKCLSLKSTTKFPLGYG